MAWAHERIPNHRVTARCKKHTTTTITNNNNPDNNNPDNNNKIQQQNVTQTHWQQQHRVNEVYCYTRQGHALKKENKRSALTKGIGPLNRPKRSEEAVNTGPKNRLCEKECKASCRLSL